MERRLSMVSVVFIYQSLSGGAPNGDVDEGQTEASV
jgi:hypothetical protein